MEAYLGYATAIAIVIFIAYQITSKKKPTSTPVPTVPTKEYDELVTMSKADLIAYGASVGVQLVNSMSKEDMITKLITKDEVPA